jgi:hypothetical protein
MNAPASIFTPSWLTELELDYGRDGDCTRPIFQIAPHAPSGNAVRDALRPVPNRAQNAQA